ncbi:MAG: hypothetical protein HYX92_20615 [Chloroflexi bacterium]|nr:hypothetical protein [Chloroflexota bacterium]
MAPVPKGPQPGGATAAVIKPGEPFSNLVKLRRILRESEEYIWWADRYFRARALEELIETIDPAIVQEVRILSGPDNVDERARGDFERFKKEVETKGISVEWRIAKDFAHDRFIISGRACFNVPSIDTLLRGHYSEINETPNRPHSKSGGAKLLRSRVFPPRLRNAAVNSEPVTRHARQHLQAGASRPCYPRDWRPFAGLPSPTLFSVSGGGITSFPPAHLPTEYA